MEDETFSAKALYLRRNEKPEWIKLIFLTECYKVHVLRVLLYNWMCQSRLLSLGGGE